ncbi:sensor histidine kinase [Amylibacter sp. SFDW26]|uniref:sensor histidine kinase n=1 Tax=Amylibacter sp. SFDW26 TaxID=2652722 RepID=UPI0012616DDC|nr:ATP-binding protein [Amylibacter sp. SFDW26]KAB7615994.1 sensor histidine kinase [Amylibacter sp. SFDW26]
MSRSAVKNSEYTLAIILLLAAGMILAVFYTISAQTFENIEKTQSRSKLALYQSTIENELLRLQHLPSVIANNPLVFEALETDEFDTLNAKLLEISNAARAEAIYLMKPSGLTVAASNYSKPQTFIGQNYGFRSYFKEASKGLSSTFFAIGATTSRPGYFLASPIISQGQTLGVLALKLDLTALNRILEETNELIFVTNPDGIVVLSSKPSQRYNAITSITTARLDKIKAERQFGKHTIGNIDWSLNDQTHVSFEKSTYYLSQSNIIGTKWVLHYLVDTSAARQKALGIVSGVAIIMALSALAFVFWRVQRVRRALTASIEDRKRLQREIETRRQAEADLKNAQKELKRSSKMAALGQLSASVTHELGQPISAMKNHITAEEITVGKLSPVMTHLSGILGRMENITHQLRFFSASGSETSSVVSLADVINNAYELIRHDCERHNVTYLTHGLDQDIQTWGNQTRLEQVLINLMKNSIKAMADQALKKLDVNLMQTNDHITITVKDTGQGLQGQSLDQIVEPFHTTASSGEGMGLGLAISTSIINEHAGTLDVAENTNGGACFTITLPKHIE